MKPVTQNRVYPKVGNCGTACLASIFEVPIEETFDGDPEVVKGHLDHTWYTLLHEWLNARGFAYMPVKMAPYGYSVAVGQSPRIREDGKTVPHACVALDGKLVHDPHPDRTFFGEKEPYEYWVFYALDPTRLSFT